ncbi:MAG: sucrose phosphorylase [Anaerolineales bacterium]|nr:sucrose phosphorylase [Anaerolineales bacterium]
MTIKNQVQLITYPDSLGGDLKVLHRVLETHFKEVFKGGIHILPPFPSSGDRGFAPLTYLEIEPVFGAWEDIKRIGEKYNVLLDLMVNHISAKSIYFQDFLNKGRKSEFADLFLPVEKLWPDGGPSHQELEKLFLRRENPYSDFTIEGNGETIRVWTTFGRTNPSEQIDMDINSEIFRQLIREFLTGFSQNKVKIVRLDAVGYVIKKPGTSCFFVEPEIYQFLDWIAELARSLDIALLLEVHDCYRTQFKLAEHGYWIYDFILPYTVLHTLVNRNSKKLIEYLKIRPHRQFTMLDCHDGVPVKPDVNDLYDSADAHRLVEICLERGSNLSLIYSPEHRDPDGFDVHQICGTYYSMLGCDDHAYLAARAIQFFTPGVPQVYYVGLLAGENDLEVLKYAKDGREINRHNYTLEEIQQEVKKEVVQRLLNLIRFRNKYPAFDGQFSVVDSEDEVVHLVWQKGEKQCWLKINLVEDYQCIIKYITDEGQAVEYQV